MTAQIDTTEGRLLELGIWQDPVAGDLVAGSDGNLYRLTWASRQMNTGSGMWVDAEAEAVDWSEVGDTGDAPWDSPWTFQVLPSRRTVAGALQRPEVCEVLSWFAGKRVGSAEAQQAMDDLAGVLPAASVITYTLDELVDAALRVDAQGRYQVRGNGRPR